ncbi:hypothetical protein FOA43_002701 [Brettanomyces nanus]|uniref:Uncharacterized protein n=1 Tax=Eeniella nana TaxID=13502 RepID=A0A875S318_EENNA|nr:uncharacterized protein FOA43_002701 [Brettanomyces nanus]QPG75348.1 hypothetical protein FOA43_002701 [Brettanomyces nanus]
MSDDDELVPIQMFAEPESYVVPTPKGKEITYHLSGSGEPVYVNLLGSSPLYGHILTNACKYLAGYLENHTEDLVKTKNVLEYGAGGALPSLICAKSGASMVVATDYPDADLISNIQKNIDQNHVNANCKTVGFIWGNDPKEIMAQLDSTHAVTFDTIILSDVIFNHTEHYKLLKSCKQMLTPITGKVLVTFSPHRPWLFKEDMDFFNKAEEQDFAFVPELVEMKHYLPLFKDDKDESTKEIRSRVYFYMLHASK